jgi:endopeptidase La
MQTNNKLNLYKLKLLQNNYKDISTIIYNLTNHLIFLESIYIVDPKIKSEILRKLYYINKNINSIYNNYIINNFDKNVCNNLFNDLLKITNDSLLYLFNSMKFFDNVPFNNELNKLIEIINLIGYNSVLKILDINKINIKLFSHELINLLKELDDIFIPITFKIYSVDVNKNLEYYWRSPNIFNENDILQITRELWIKRSENLYIKIEGIFNNDILSVKLKTSQIISNNLYNKKLEILKIIEKEKKININFVKNFIRYDYIGNLYSMKIEDYILYLNNSYILHEQLIKSSFVNIMKNFINNGSKLYNLYFIIFLLLLGDEDNADVASLLINITKEKKVNSINLYNLINRNLSFFLQEKIKKSSNNIKADLEKLKLLSLETIDYKKQLLSMKNISDTVKSLTLEKIEEMKVQNNEYYKQKSFVENIIKFPWSSQKNNFYNFESKKDIANYLNNINKKLDDLTYGHEEAKNILLQTIARWISDPNSGGKPFGFVGPPGVGKTLLAKSVSKALDIPFAEITLGGQNDGELLHGHGYTYSGSQPGIIIRKMVEMGKDRCILYFDELDKTASKHGKINEITSILIHLTDPNMNKTFQDRFFQGIDFPLDKVIMIFSYNDSDKIDPILLDRITEIKINPYSLNDKVKIIKNFVIPEFNIKINIEDEIIEYIINNYTNEAGIRNIKRQIEKIFLTLNLETLLNKINIDNYKLTIEEVNRILLKPINDITKINNKPEIGIINGLYATNIGDGGIIQIQIYNNFISNNFEIKLTGNQGNVMKESVQCSLTCAINYIRNNLNNLNNLNLIDFENYYKNKFKNGFHVHAPSTSTPKDGPSAGCAFTCAFISRILNKPIKNYIGMTGEIELTGKITKIGGLNYKLIGAKKAGIKIVYIPYENKEDLDEFKIKYENFINEDFNVKMVNNIDEIILDIIIF